jgi:hypothetical protein
MTTKVIQLVHYVKNVTNLSPIYTGPFDNTDEDEREALYERIRKGFYPTPEEVQKYDKYQLVMRYWILRKLAGLGPITSLRRLRYETRRIRRAYRKRRYRKREHKLRFLKALIY